MSRCHIARRIASPATVENTCAQGVSAQTWATKVFHLLLQSLSRAGRAVGRRTNLPSERQAAVNSGVEGSVRRAGVRPQSGGGGARRLASHPSSPATPFTTASLATNDEASEVTR